MAQNATHDQSEPWNVVETPYATVSPPFPITTHTMTSNPSQELPEKHFGAKGRSYGSGERNSGKSVPEQVFWFDRKTNGDGGMLEATLELFIVWDRKPAGDDLKMEVPLLEVKGDANGSRPSTDEGVKSSRSLVCDLSEVPDELFEKKSGVLEDRGEVREWYEMKYTLTLETSDDFVSFGTDVSGKAFTYLSMEMGDVPV